MFKERILRNFLLLSVFWSVALLIYFNKGGGGSLHRLSVFTIESNVFNPEEESLKSQVLDNLDATIRGSPLQNINFRSEAINVMKQPMPVLFQENGGMEQLIPVLAQETRGMEQPISVLAQETGEMKQPLPVLAQETEGVKQPIAVLAQETGETIRKMSQIVQEDYIKKSKQPIQNVIFIKTHKTGSSTVTNVMQRYAKLNKLNVALPDCDHRFCYPNKFDEIFLYKHVANETYNILFNHAVFNKEKMVKIMVSPDTKIVTIIREPFSQFDSAAQYLNFRKHYNLTYNSQLLDEFFKKSDESLKNMIKFADLSQGEGAFSLAKNPNAFDFGFDVWNETPEYIENVINSINRDIHLVMIMEHMEESLVLLKNELNWNLEDVVFNVHNARKFKDKNTDDENRIRERILNWNKIDTAIYNSFKEKFWEKIKTSPPGFDEDVKKLKEWNQSLVNHCKFSIPTDMSIFLIKKYNKQGNFCEDFLREDSDFTTWFKNMRHFKVKRLLHQKFLPN